MILRVKFSVPKICCRRWIQATHTCHSEVSTRFLGRPAFQLPMFAKCDALLQRDLSDTFVLGIHACYFCHKDIQLMQTSESR